ncbi:MAG: biopolymer transporter ExbD [Pirellulales bacterium]
MKLPVVTRRGEDGINMTPMIDVVFQLLIFFLVASHLSQQETQLELALPQAAHSEKEADEPEPRVVINVPREGELLLGAQKVDLPELAARLAAEKNKLGGNVEIRIRADRATPYRAIEPILRTCAEAGLWKVTFAVTRSDS